MKTCSRCKQQKEITEFYTCSHAKSGYKCQCKECVKDAVRRSSIKHSDKVLERNRKYRAANPDKVQKWKAKDRKVNKSRILADNAGRRAKLKSKLTSEIKQIYALRDFYTSMSLGEVFHVDHKIPVSLGGLHEASNLQVIPAIDNLRKSNKIIDMKQAK